ncbi:MAG: putative dehydrogenase [Candidatus Azotimanducaceae bacterium]
MVANNKLRETQALIRVGIAGFGKMGKIRAKAVLAHADMELVAVFDINESVLDGLADVVGCASFDDLLKQDIDALVICAFNSVASEYAAKGLQAGFHVFCEKPPAKTVAELEVVRRIEDSTGLILKYGFNHRFHYSVIEAKKIMDSGEMGNILWMRGVYGKAGSIDYHKEWRNYRQYSGGGILMDQGIHMLDLMLYFSGQKFSDVHAYLTNAHWDVEAEDNAFVMMKTKDGLISTIHSSATQWRHKFLLEIMFEHGYLNLDGILSETRSYAPERLIIGKSEKEHITYAMGKPDEIVMNFEQDDSWQLEINEFADAINGNKAVLHGRSSDAMNVMELIEAIYDQSGYYQNA